MTTSSLEGTGQQPRGSAQQAAVSGPASRADAPAVARSTPAEPASQPYRTQRPPLRAVSLTGLAALTGMVGVEHGVLQESAAALLAAQARRHARRQGLGGEAGGCR